MTYPAPQMTEFPRLSTGKLQKYTSVGCYPLFYVTGDSKCLCPDCANEVDEDPEIKDTQGVIIAANINWWTPSLDCDECSQQIESAYAED